MQLRNRFPVPTPILTAATSLVFAAGLACAAEPGDPLPRPDTIADDAHYLGRIFSDDDFDDILDDWEDEFEGGYLYRPRFFGFGGEPSTLGSQGIGFASPRIRIGGQLQFRYTADFRDDDGVEEEFAHGFEAVRTKILVETDLTESLGARLSFNAGSLSNGAPTGESGSEFEVEDAYASWRVSDGLYLKWGQFKPNYLYEESVDDAYQTFVDRSPIAEYLGQQWTEGVQLTWQGDSARVSVGVFDGFGTWGTSYDSPDESDISIGVRGDLKFGDAPWRQFGDFSSWRGNDWGLRLGGALVYQSFGETGAASPVDDAQRIDYTLDGQLEGDGWAVGGSFAGMYVDLDDGPIDDISSHAFNVFASFFITSQLEFVGRLTGLYPDTESVTGDEDDFYFVEAGANYYFVPESHALKLQVDFVWALDETAGLGSVSNNNGIRPVGNGALTGLLGSMDEDELAIRAQIQMLF